MEIEERYELASSRLNEWISGRESEELPEVFRGFMLIQAELLMQLAAILRNPLTMANEAVNRRLYDDIVGDNYEKSFTNPAFCKKHFDGYGDKISGCLNWFATHVRDAIVPAYEQDIWTVLIWLELFLELEGVLKNDEQDELSGSLKETIYYFIHDYDEMRMERRIREMVVPDGDSSVSRIVMESNLKNPDYLYQYGEYIGKNEFDTWVILSGMNEGIKFKAITEDWIDLMARVYVDGYRKGFEAAGIDLSEKKTVEIRYPIGFERIVRQAVYYFRDLGLEPTFRRLTNTNAIGVVSIPPNRQYLHDHRFDDALILNQALATERLKHVKAAFEKYREEAYAYAGPAVIETFGEALFVPSAKKEAPKYTSEQEKISLEYKRDFALLQDEFIPGDKRSFTIIAFPVPEIGEHYGKILRETMRLNSLDTKMYQRIHQAIIDALDQGEYVRILGCGENRTDMKVMLHTLDDPAHQTNFENCLADVNIPVGEVFTSPVLTGTEGTLHVSHVYLNGLCYKDLRLVFKDGMVTDYACGNYEDPKEGRNYIKENVLHNHESLPIGEFAIGTNTAAYAMGRIFDIEDKLPILIAEKTGPHFAVGDTCYSMSEEVVVHNPDGKEIIAKDNECSIKRKEDASKAYFQCHTDITIPYDELGSISVFTKDGKETIIIKDGKFVLQGTEALNEPLEQLKGGK